MDHGCCSEGISKLDLSVFTSVKRIEIGNGCCHSVTEVVIIGLPCVEVIHIGDSSFTMQEEEEDFQPLRFLLKDCKQLRELKSGHSSFNSFTECIIEDTPSLETIKLGDVSFSLSSGCFMYSDLQLRSPSVCLLSR